MKCCMNCKYFKSYRELYDDDPQEPEDCGECSYNDTKDIDGNYIFKMQDDWATQGDDENKCRFFKHR